jgi:integrase
MTEIDGKIAQANGRLKAANVGVTIERNHNRLYLRATFPPRPTSNRIAPHQQRLALGIHANPAGASLAEKEARKVGALLDCGEFDWQPYLRTGSNSSPVGTVGYWVEQFEAAHRNRVAAVTWKTDYHQVFEQLDRQQLLTSELLQKAIEGTEQTSRQRRRFCTTLTKFARFAGLNATFDALRGRYSTTELEPRDLPSDELIVECFNSIKNPAWRWVYGVIAVFGLRNHEVFYLDTSILENGGDYIRVIEGKTGGRNVWAFHQKWIEVFNLRQPILPSVSAKTHAQYGERVTQYFHRDLELPFTAYDLRHCWAIRTMIEGLDISLAAQQMGHSLKVHSDTYHRWISDSVHQSAYDALFKRPR